MLSFIVCSLLSGSRPASASPLKGVLPFSGVGLRVWGHRGDADAGLKLGSGTGAILPCKHHFFCFITLGLELRDTNVYEP